MEAKPIDEMTADEINREIAERRGWPQPAPELGLKWNEYRQHGWEWDDEAQHVIADYREWQHAGALLEDLLASCRSIGLLLRDDNSVDLTMQMGGYINERQLRAAVPRAWLAWDRGKDDAQ